MANSHLENCHCNEIVRSNDDEETIDDSYDVLHNLIISNVCKKQIRKHEYKTTISFITHKEILHKKWKIFKSTSEKCEK